MAALVADGTLSLHGLITHTFGLGHAREAYGTVFGDQQCSRMMLDWRG